MKVTLHSLELKIPYQLFKRVKIAAAAMNITNSKHLQVIKEFDRDYIVKKVRKTAIN